jgi:hypothetical protein
METVNYKHDTKKTLEPLEHLKENDYLLYWIGWLQNSDLTGLVNEDDAEIGSRKKLALSLFDCNQRLSLAERLNILAVHKTKMHEVSKKFETQKLG